MSRRAAQVLWCMLCGCAGAQQAPAELTVTAMVEVKRALLLDAEDGARVELVELRTGSALIRVTGVEDEIADVVLEHQREERSHGYAWMTTVHGRPRGTLFYEDRPGRSTWTLYVPGVYREGKQVVVDEAKSKERPLDTQGLLRTYAEQKANGRLAALQRFDRKREERRIVEELTDGRNAALRACAMRADAAIEWDSIDDATIKEYSISSYCGNIFDELKNVCQYQAARDLLRGITSVRCRFGKPVGVSRQGTLLRFTADAKTSNLYLVARSGLRGLSGPGDRKLAQLILEEQTDVCLADPRRVIILAPHDTPQAGVSYGDGTTFVHSKPLWGLSVGWFSDPRQFNPSRHPEFRGHDLRRLSVVEVDREHQACTLTCGERATRLKLASAAERGAILARAVYRPSPHQREPHALARDTAGIYYYVDRGTEKGAERDFHVFIGPRGLVREQQMKDIVSDSEGEIFSTTGGKLRLVVGKSQAFWITGGKKRELVLLPISENLKVIYTDLGVYRKQPLGVPCDDF